MSSLLEEISKEVHPIGTRSEIGADPELDEFMVNSLALIFIFTFIHISTYVYLSIY